MSSTASTTPTSLFDIHNLFSVSGRRALVTGGGSGLGSYAAMGLALNGAKVYIVGRRKEKLEGVKQDFEKRKAEKEAPEAAAKGQVIPLPGDISSKDGLKKLVEELGAKESGLDILINGAGVLGNKLPLDPSKKDDTSAVQPALFDEEWDNWSSVLNTNTISPYFTTLAFVPLLSKSSPATLRDQGPVVLNVTSIAALHISRATANSHVYQVSKDAEEKLSKILAGRLLPYRIRVNSIAPGIYPSEMTEQPTPESFMEKAKTMVPGLQRSGTPDDFVGLILFLSSRAGAYLNGSQIVTDGGRLLVSSAA